MFHLIIYIAVNVQVVTGTEAITLLFILELKYLWNHLSIILFLQFL